jgi:putative DNA primase/helicase
MNALHDSHVSTWSTIHDAHQHRAHVGAWVKHHARQLSRKAIADGYKPSALHEYTDRDNIPTHWRTRLKHPDTGVKWIRPLMRDGTGFALKQPDYPSGTPLYRLHELATRKNEPVLIVEGESCTDALANLGVLATTSGAADSAAKADWSILRGRTVTIWPDNDDAGQRYAEAVKNELDAIGCVVTLIDVAALGLPVKGDCVDWLAMNPDAAASDVAALPKINPPESTLSASNDVAGALPYAASEVTMLRGCDIKPEAINWLWPGYLASGKFHILGGAPSTGKTTIGMSFAATVTTGGNWPDGSYSQQGNVVIWTGEDDPGDTLAPRLIMSGADMSRIYFVGDVVDSTGKRSFDPSRDMKPLANKMADIGSVRLLIVDPIVSAIAGDSHKNAEVRRGLQPLVDLAMSMRCALVGITHFSKGTGGRDPVERITGSLAFGALARVVLVAARHQEEDEGGNTKRVMLRAKSNIGADDGGFEYDIEQGELNDHPGVIASAVRWGAQVEGGARELLATADSTGNDGEGGTLGDAERFLSDLLADGALPTKTIKIDADGAGYSWATIRRAQKALGVDAVKSGMKGGWEWSLPRRCSMNTEDAQQNNVSTFGRFERLRDSKVTVKPIHPPINAEVF